MCRSLCRWVCRLPYRCRVKQVEEHAVRPRQHVAAFEDVVDEDEPAEQHGLDDQGWPELAVAEAANNGEDSFGGDARRRVQVPHDRREARLV